MELLILALLAAGGIYLVTHTQLGEQGLQGTYVDDLGIVWNLAIVSNTADSGTHWEAHEASINTNGTCTYRYADNTCPYLKAETKDALISQIKAVVSAYRKEKGI